MKKLLISIVLLAVILSGCTIVTEDVGKNVAIVDVKIDSLRDAGSYKYPIFYATLIKGSNKQEYQLVSSTLYNSIKGIRDASMTINGNADISFDVIIRGGKYIESAALSKERAWK